MSDRLYDAITSLSKHEAVIASQELLAGGTDPQAILDVGRAAMQVIGDRFERGEYFLPELIVSGDILAAIADEVKPYLRSEASTDNLGTVVFGTVAGDIHDIAKDIVVLMLEVNGFEVVDLGVDVAAAQFVQAVQKHRARIVGLSGFLTLAIEPMKQTVAALRAAGLDEVKVMIGGGPVDELVCQDTGADAWGANALDAVTIAKEWAGVSR